MKTITSKTILMLLTGAFLVLLFNSCTKDPVIPEDETKNKLHEDPAKVTVRLERILTSALCLPPPGSII